MRPPRVYELIDRVRPDILLGAGSHLESVLPGRRRARRAEAPAQGVLTRGITCRPAAGAHRGHVRHPGDLEVQRDGVRSRSGSPANSGAASTSTRTSATSRSSIEKASTSRTGSPARSCSRTSSTAAACCSTTGSATWAGSRPACCSCGRTTQVLADLEGRTSEYVTLPDGSIVGPLIVTEALNPFPASCASSSSRSRRRRSSCDSPRSTGRRSTTAPPSAADAVREILARLRRRGRVRRRRCRSSRGRSTGRSCCSRTNETPRRDAHDPPCLAGPAAVPVRAARRSSRRATGACARSSATPHATFRPTGATRSAGDPRRRRPRPAAADPRKDLLDDRAAFRSDAVREADGLVIRTSGSSGESLDVLHDSRSVLANIAYSERERAVVRTCSERRPTATLAFEYSLGTLLVVRAFYDAAAYRPRRPSFAFVPSEEPLERCLEALRSIRPDVVIGTGSWLEAIFREVVAAEPPVPLPRLLVSRWIGDVGDRPRAHRGRSRHTGRLALQRQGVAEDRLLLRSGDAASTCTKISAS